jgi:phosphoglycerate kinase
MPKRTVRDVNVAGKRVFIRVDFNVPTDDDGTITDDRRIRSALPTIQLVLDGGGSAILASHMGRPVGDLAKDVPYKLDRVADRLRQLLPGVPITKCDEVVGPQALEMARDLPVGGILILENLRFHKGEKKGDIGFAKELAALADIYVNDAFGTCHREDASMFALPQQFPKGSRVVGLLVEKELHILDQLLSQPSRPMIALMGGAKVSDKIGVIEALLPKIDRLLIGGAMTYTFRKSLGQSVGNSRVESDKIDLAKELLQKAGAKLELPVDHVVADRLEPPQQITTTGDDIPDGWLALDIGPKTIARYSQAIASAGTVIWNGPMGKFEDEPFQTGTRGIAEAMAASDAVTVVGGGESADAVQQFGFDAKITHVSTGGGAFLEYIEGKPFAALTAIDDA